MTESEFRKRAMQMKGEVIDNMAMLEHLISFLLADYMSKKNLMFGMAVLNKLNFNAKIEMFKFLLEQKNVDLKTRHPKLLKEINDMQILRNKFAHSTIKIDHKEVFDANDSFYMMDSYKFDSKPLQRTTYNVIEHSKNLMKVHLTLNILTVISGHKAFKKTKK
jgi:hypothetical protein